MVLKLVTRQMLINAMVQSHVSPSCRHNICTESWPMCFLYGPLDVWKQLGEFKSTDGHAADKIVIVLVLYGVQNEDCVPDTTQDIQFKYQRKQKCLLKGLAPRGNCIAVCKYVVIKCAIMNRGKWSVCICQVWATEWLVWCKDVTSETIKLTEFSRWEAKLM